MKHQKRVSLWAAARQIGGYPQLLLKLAQEHGLEIHVKGRARYVRREDLGQLAWLVNDWLNRPRKKSQASAKAPAERLRCRESR